ncbi:MAG: class I SAM-dependent methyltransferase, partial [Candidatus Micrarchaeota archaeon]
LREIEADPVRAVRLAADYWAGGNRETQTIPNVKRPTLQTAKLLTDALGLNKGGRMLEVGCGTGEVCAEIRGWGVDAVGMDISLGKVAPGGRYVEGSVEAIPFPDGSFNMVLDSLSIYYTDMDKATAEIRRVLTPDGVSIHVLHHIEYVEWSLKVSSGVGTIEWLGSKSERARGAVERHYPLAKLMTNVFESKDDAVAHFERHGLKALRITEATQTDNDGSKVGVAYILVVQKQ